MSSVIPVIRWGLAFPAAIAVTAVVQGAVYAPLAMAFGRLGTYEPWTMWLPKCISCFFMGISMVAVASLIAPNRKHVAATAALGLVLLWGATLIVGSLFPRVMVWIVAMGAIGIMGGIVAFVVANRSFTPNRAV